MQLLKLLTNKWRVVLFQNAFSKSSRLCTVFIDCVLQTPFSGGGFYHTGTNVSRRMNTHGRFFTIITKEGNCCDFLFACMYTKPSWKKSEEKEVAPGRAKS